MGSTLSDGFKMAIAMIIMCAIIGIVLTIVSMVREWDYNTRLDLMEVNVKAIDNFQTMAVYGKPVPMSNVVAALDLYGIPETLCLQMEDLKNTMEGTPYPMATNSAADTERMQTLITTMRNYYNKKVYVYYATPNGYLQLCVSELSHESNPDGENQDWSD